MPEHGFRDREAAGRALAEHLDLYRDAQDLLILALPRGGVPVAYEVARAFNAQLDVILVRKLGVPGHRELAMGAIASGGVRVVDDRIVKLSGVSRDQLARTEAEELRELERREELYRGGRPAPVIEGRTAILIDDGLATGSSMKAAVGAVRAQKPKHLVVAVPVAPPDARGEFADIADDYVCLLEPWHFAAVGQWYQNFGQTSDAEVCELLARSAERSR